MGRFQVLDLDAEVMDAGTGAGQSGFGGILAVVLNDREVDDAVRQVAGGVVTFDCFSSSNPNRPL